MNHSWNHDPFQGGGPVPHRPKKQRRPIGTPVGRTLLNLAVTLVFGAIYFYVTLPPLNLHSGDFYVFALLLCAVYCGCAVLTSGFQGSGAKGYFGFVKKQCTVPFVLGLVLVVTALIGAAIGWEVFRAGSYRDLLTEEPEESMVICTPFDKPGCFYFNQKINCMRARGQVRLGEKTYVFDPADSFGVLDWGRGVWTYHNTWYWGSASGQVEGVPFGWNIGYGFGDTSAASENMLFYGGKAHKLSQVRFHIPQREGRDDFLSPWCFTSDDGRFEMKFVPILDRAACTDVKLIKSDQHQVFGRFTGTATLDDGTVIRVRDMIGFAEKVENKW